MNKKVDILYCKICNAIIPYKRGRQPYTCSPEHKVIYKNLYQKFYRRAEAAQFTDADRAIINLLQKGYRDNMPADKKAARLAKQKIYKQTYLAKLKRHQGN